MKVPPWDCYTVEDRRAFEFFVMQKLDDAALTELHAAPDGDVLEYMEKMAAIAADKSDLMARAAAAELDFKPPPPSRGRKKKQFEGTPFECAVHDVKRMRSIFQKYWGKSNRLTNPMREEIAGRRWSLSDDEITALKKLFLRPKKEVSGRQ